MLIQFEYNNREFSGILKINTSIWDLIKKNIIENTEITV